MRSLSSRDLGLAGYGIASGILCWVVLLFWRGSDSVIAPLTLLLLARLCPILALFSVGCILYKPKRQLTAKCVSWALGVSWFTGFYLLVYR